MSKKGTKKTHKEKFIYMVVHEYENEWGTSMTVILFVSTNKEKAELYKKHTKVNPDDELYMQTLQLDANRGVGPEKLSDYVEEVETLQTHF
ncbi:hypothetical protein [Lactobacillus phage Lbab1]|nr:hypothetical protein [Lactobacillus phage Lbab1]